MKSKNLLLLLILLTYIQNLDITGRNLVLKDGESTLDGTKLSSTPTDGVSYSNQGISITESGTYILSGTLNGQLSVSVPEKIVLVLNGVTITSTTNGIIILKASEIDQNNPLNPSSFSVNLENVGAKIIIADGTENTVKGGNSGEHDGAIHTCVSLLFAGETKGDGVLNVISSGEGIESDLHLFFNGGIIKVIGNDDAINAHEENRSIVYVKSGKLFINGGLGQEGDGIDSNGYIIIDGGEIVSSAKAGLDSGLDSEHTTINGGNIFAVGSALDYASDKCTQPTMNLIFKDNLEPSSVLTIKDSDGNEITSYCANKADFVSGSERKTFNAAIVSHPNFKSGGVYHVFLDGSQLGFTGNQPGIDWSQGFPGGGMPWGGNQGGNQQWPGGNQQWPGGNQQWPGGNQQWPGGNQQWPGGNQQWPGGNQQWPGGNQGNQQNDNAEIKTDFILGNSATSFSGIRKIL